MEPSKISKSDFKSILIIILIVIIIMSGVLVYNYFITREQFTSFYILDEQGGTDFPQEIQVNHQYNLTVVITNYEQTLMLYKIYIRVGNMSTNINKTHPADFYTNSTFFETNIMHGQSRNFNVNINMTIVQNETKLIAELWKYNVLYSQYFYSGQFLFIHFNVTN
ncbi:MAG: DUF1616 domain-containing protein [Candidatus Helarchaeota archaeon]